MPSITKGKMDFDTREVIPVPNSKEENLEKSKKLANVNLKLPWKTLDCRPAGHVLSSRFQGDLVTLDGPMSKRLSINPDL